MVQAVAGEEGYVRAVVLEDGDGGGGLAPGGGGGEEGDGVEAFELAETGAADDADAYGLLNEKKTNKVLVHCGFFFWVVGLRMYVYR